ncbi:MAG: ABC transporter permease [Kofleriaceae bacterium]|nr:ABC transporter permease [Kofleriaceae bacterium]MBP6837155.1 ABC transporter permease [Kofleriaceae bacterium]MBP9204397.1 ABC transporter permease [Kofleriaceae bacterium]
MSAAPEAADDHRPRIGRSGGGLLNLVRLELVKLVHRRGSYVGFGLCLAFCLIVGVGFGLSKWRSLDRWGGGVVNPKAFINGPFFANFCLQIGFFALMPLLTAALGGGQLAGEARDGTLRVVLVRPIGRVPLYWAKVIATYLWVQAMVLFLVVLALLIGQVLYGGDRLMVFVWEFRKAGPFVLEARDWLWVVPLASLGAGLSLFVIAAFAMMLSAMTESPAAAQVAAVGTFLMSSVLHQLPEELLSSEFRQLLPTVHMNFWHELYRLAHPRMGPDVDRIVTDLAWCGGLTVVFLVVGMVVFRRRDITA